jgi:hypothetical protein
MPFCIVDLTKNNQDGTASEVLCSAHGLASRFIADCIANDRFAGPSWVGLPDARPRSLTSTTAPVHVRQPFQADLPAWLQRKWTK